MLWYRIDYRRRDMGVGRYPEISLVRAREMPTEGRRHVAEGRDPLVERRAVSGCRTRS